MHTRSQAKKDATELQEKSKSMKAEIVRAEEAAKEAEAVRDKALMGIGNLVHDTVPVNNDEVRRRRSLPQPQCYPSLDEAYCSSVQKTFIFTEIRMAPALGLSDARALGHLCPACTEWLLSEDTHAEPAMCTAGSQRGGEDSRTPQGRAGAVQPCGPGAAAGHCRSGVRQHCSRYTLIVTS